MNQDINELVARLRPADAGRVDALFPAQRRAELLREIVRRQHPNAAAPARRSVGPSRLSRPRTFKIARRPALISTLGASAVAAVAAIAALLLSGAAVRPSPAAGAVAFRSVSDGDIVATVTDPFVAESQLRAAFAQHHLDITVTLVPVSPSLVGTVIYTSDDGGASAIEPLQGGHCVTGGGGCPIGVKIPAGFTGTGYITLGRPARPGETYESQASAFAPGEELHCSGLLGAQVASALPVLNADKLVAQWRQDTTNTAPDGTSTSTSKTLATAPASNYIWDAVMTAPGQLIVWTEPAPWPDDAKHGAAVNAGC